MCKGKTKKGKNCQIAVTHGDYCFYHRDQAMEIDVIPALTEQLTKVCINYTKVKMENPKEAKIVSQKKKLFFGSRVTIASVFSSRAFCTFCVNLNKINITQSRKKILTILKTNLTNKILKTNLINKNLSVLNKSKAGSNQSTNATKKHTHSKIR